METKISKALYELLKELYQSRAAKEFVDAYEREEQVREWSSEDFDYWLKLTDSVRRKMFPDHVCDEEKHERRHQSQAVPLNRSIEKDNAHHGLIKRKDLEKIQQAAKTFVDICNREERRKQERETPKNGEVYRDIFGNRYVIVGKKFLDGKQTCIAMLSFDCKDIPTVTNFFTVPLEDFFNPTFKKE